MCRLKAPAIACSWLVRRIGPVVLDLSRYRDFKVRQGVDRDSRCGSARASSVIVLKPISCLCSRCRPAWPESPEPFYVPQVGIINPGEFAPANSIEAVIWVAVGGRGTLRARCWAPSSSTTQRRSSPPAGSRLTGCLCLAGCSLR